MTSTTATEKTSQLIEKYLDLKEQGEKISEQMDLIKARLADLHPDGTETPDGHKVTISAAGRINEKALMVAFPAHDHPDLYAVKPVTAKVRAKIAPEALEQFLTYGKPSVRIS